MKLSLATRSPLSGLMLLSCALLTGQAARAQTILGSTAGYAVMAGGTVTFNGAMTAINGDLGAALIAGAGGRTVTGSTGPISGQNLSDFTRAFSGLAAMPWTVDLTGKTLGTTAGAIVLTPGIYHFDSTAQLTGTLTLDAQNQANAVWVFQVGSTFTSAANAKVVFTNLAAGSPANDGLFWQVGTTTTFGASTTMEGNFLSGTTFDVGSGSSLLHGRILTGSDTITLASDTFDFVAADSGYSGGLAFDGGSNTIGAVPEPATFALLAAGAVLGVACWRRASGAKAKRAASVGLLRVG